MKGGSNPDKLLKEMSPRLNEGEYVFVTLRDLDGIDRSDSICEFKEEEGTTVVIEKSKADKLNLSYDFVAAWITLDIHSSLEALGLTAAFSGKLASHNISCNVIAGYYHDHIFVPKKDAARAMKVLKAQSE